MLISLKLGALVTFGAVFLASAAAADYTPSLFNPPSVSEVAAAYPVRAKAASVSGAVTLTCQIDRNNHSRDCAP